MSNILEFDGTFEGFLTLVAFSYEIRVMPERIITHADALTLFDEPLFIQTKEALATRVYHAMKQKFHPKHLRLIHLAWLYDEAPLYKELLTFIRRGFKEASELDDITQPSIKKVHDGANYTLKERHKMLGFIRFVKLDDSSFYAKITPKSNILSLLGEHFKERFNDPWIIHDTKRELALIHKDGTVQYHHVASSELPLLHQEEKHFQRLWQKFFKQVTITERTNLKLQRHFIPLFYRNVMTEFQSLDSE